MTMAAALQAMRCNAAGSSNSCPGSLLLTCFCRRLLALCCAAALQLSGTMPAYLSKFPRLAEIK
jgi:hypothetical protein